jgi:hypothetical protein
MTHDTPTRAAGATAARPPARPLRCAALGLIAAALLAAPGPGWAGQTPGPAKDSKEKKGRGKAAPAAASAAMVAPTAFGETIGRAEYEASGVVALDDSRFLFCANNIDDALFELRLTPDGRKAGPLVRRTLSGLGPGGAADLEGITIAEADGRRFVIVTSSFGERKGGKKGQQAGGTGGLLRVTVNADSSLSAENMPGFREWLLANSPELAASAGRAPDQNGLNIEGLAWDPERRTLLFGVRTPVHGGRPLVVPVRLGDPGGPWRVESLERLPAIPLSVESARGEQGIRGIEYDATRKLFLVIVANATSQSEAAFTLYEWDGNDAGNVRRVPVAFAPKMKAEGVAHGSIGGKGALVFVDDAGGYNVRWDGM